MQVKELKNEGLNREYSIVIGATDLAQSTEGRLKAMSGKMKVPGFRPGHIPMNLLKQRYGQSVMGEVLEEAVQHSVQQVVRDKSLKPALQPKVEVVKFEEGGDLEFKVKMELMPTVPDIKFETVKLERLTFKVADSEVEEAMKRFAERNKKFTTKEGKAASGDVVRIDFLGKKDDVAFDGGAASNFRLELGSNQFIPGFEDQLIGAKAGDDVLVKVSFPKEYHKEDLAGAPVTFDVKVHEVLAAGVPDVDAEFAKNLGFENVDKLRDAIREQIAKDYNNIARNKLKKQLFDHLEESVVFEVPQGMVDLEFESIWKRLQEAKAAGDDSLDKPEDELREQYKKIAERRVRLGIVLAEVGNKNKLQVSKEEIANAVRDQAKMFPGQEQKVFEFYRNNPNQVQELHGPILEEKAVDFIISKAKLTDREVSPEELLKADEDEAESAEKKKSAKPKAAKKKKDE